MRYLLLSALGAIAALASCARGESNEATTVSIIGPAPRLTDPARRALDLPSAALLSATAQGLVAFDGAGRIVPALAQRWIVTDDGLSLIFRVRSLNWPDGSAVTSADVATALKRAMARGNRIGFARLFTGIEQVIPMTGSVIEMRFTSPQPAMLALLAQPEMAIFKRTTAQATGPFRIHSARDGVTRLRPAPTQDSDAVIDDAKTGDIRLRGEAAAMAVARFVARDAALVTGGGFTDLPYAQAARTRSGELRIDTVGGLMGLAVVDGSTALASNDLRRALAMAIDRDALLARFGVGRWRAAYAILPMRFEGTVAPAALDWVTLPIDARRSRARAIVATRPIAPTVRLAMPAGPGGRLMASAIAADWARIDIRTEIVKPGERADLRLIDAIAPATTALWFFDQLSCAHGVICNAGVEAALTAAIAATTTETRAAAIAEADAAFANHQPFIPIAQPLRWSLVTRELTGFRSNGFAIHPLTQLRDKTR